MSTPENTIRQVARFNFRLPAEIKERIERAAVASGLTVTDFAINSLANVADEVLARQTSRTLSKRDSEIFLKMIDDTPEPNDALIEAFREHSRRVK